MSDSRSATPTAGPAPLRTGPFPFFQRLRVVVDLADAANLQAVFACGGFQECVERVRAGAAGWRIQAHGEAAPRRVSAASGSAMLRGGGARGVLRGISGGSRTGRAFVPLLRPWCCSLRHRAVSLSGHAYLMELAPRRRSSGLPPRRVIGLIFAGGKSLAYLCNEATTTRVDRPDFTASICPVAINS